MSKAEIVALLAEGVDRNIVGIALSAAAKVALLAEGVDRNLPVLLQDHTTGKSPSSRRAWIEISSSCAAISAVASPSSRRAWIEISIIRIMIALSQGRPPRGGRG